MIRLIEAITEFDHDEPSPTGPILAPEGNLTSITIVAADAEHFADVTTMLGPKNSESTVCWCLTYRTRRSNQPRTRRPGAM